MFACGNLAAVKQIDRFDAAQFGNGESAKGMLNTCERCAIRKDQGEIAFDRWKTRQGLVAQRSAGLSDRFEERFELQFGEINVLTQFELLRYGSRELAANADGRAFAGRSERNARGAIWREPLRAGGPPIRSACERKHFIEATFQIAKRKFARGFVNGLFARQTRSAEGHNGRCDGLFVAHFLHFADFEEPEILMGLIQSPCDGRGDGGRARSEQDRGMYG